MSGGTSDTEYLMNIQLQRKAIIFIRLVMASLKERDAHSNLKVRL